MLTLHRGRPANGAVCPAMVKSGKKMSYLYALCGFLV